MLLSIITLLRLRLPELKKNTFPDSLSVFPISNVPEKVICFSLLLGSSISIIAFVLIFFPVITDESLS